MAGPEDAGKEEHSGGRNGEKQMCGVLEPRRREWWGGGRCEPDGETVASSTRCRPPLPCGACSEAPSTPHRCDGESPRYCAVACTVPNTSER